MSPAQLLDQEFLRIGLSADEQALVPVIEIVSTLQYLADEYTDSKVDYLSLRLCGDVVPYVRIVFDQEFPQLSIATAAFLNAIGWDRRATSNASLMLTLEMPNIEWDYAKWSST